MMRFIKDRFDVRRSRVASHHGCPGQAWARRREADGETERLTMNKKALRRDPNRDPTHPGALLREDVLPAIGELVMAVAKKLGVTRQHLHRVLAEKAPVTPDMAL